MTRKTITELYTQAQTDFADNVSGAITPADLRQFCLDFLDSMRPSYGAIGLTQAVGKAATTAYSAMVWESTIAAQAPDFTVSLASGTIQRAGGPASARISFSIDVVAPNNAIVTFALFINGLLTPWAVANTSTSATDIMSFAFSAVNYDASSTIQYQVQVKTNANATLTLSNGVMVVENIPVNVN